MKNQSTITKFGVCQLAALIFLPAIWAAPNFETRFEGDDGTVPDGWIVITKDPFVEIRGNALVIRRDENPGTGVARTIILDSSDSLGWTDYVVEATFRESRPGIESQRNGLLARWDGGKAFPLNAYNAYVEGEELVIALGASRGVAKSEILASSRLAMPLRPNQPYTIRFTLKGRNLKAELFDGAGSQIGLVETENDFLTAGGIGIQSYFAFGERQATYEHLAVYAPE
jgi:hypothetical protein